MLISIVYQYPGVTNPFIKLNLVRPYSNKIVAIAEYGAVNPEIKVFYYDTRWL